MKECGVSMFVRAGHCSLPARERWEGEPCNHHFNHLVSLNLTLNISCLKCIMIMTQNAHLWNHWVQQTAPERWSKTIAAKTFFVYFTEIQLYSHFLPCTKNTLNIPKISNLFALCRLFVLQNKSYAPIIMCIFNLHNYHFYDIPLVFTSYFRFAVSQSFSPNTCVPLRLAEWDTSLKAPCRKS